MQGDHSYGYAGKVLRVDLSSGQISTIPTSLYADRFVGGRGMAAKIYWDNVKPETKALDPENYIIFAMGPLAGFKGISTTRWQVCTKSPVVDPERFYYSNGGGLWGGDLKFAGYDGIVVTGASEKPVYLLIRDDKVELRDAVHLWQKQTREVRKILKDEYGEEMRVVSTGTAGDNQVVFAGLNADGDASGSGGIGAVMGSKKLKAIAVYGSGSPEAANPERLQDLAEYVAMLRELPKATLDAIAPPGSGLTRLQCYGCIGGCLLRVTYKAEDGTEGKFMCSSASYYRPRAQAYYGKATEVPFFANRLADGYGLDIGMLQPMMTWLEQCNKAGILSEQEIGLPMSKLGSLEFIEAMTKMIATREGFGDILARGLTRAANIVGKGSADLITDYVSKNDRNASYCPRLYITTGIFYATEPRQPIHQIHEVTRMVLRWVAWHKKTPGAYMSSDVLRWIGKTFWGSEIAADFSTYEGKALAGKKIQDREYAKESAIFCDFAYPIPDPMCTEDHHGDPTIESKIFSAVTGREIDEQAYYAIGERNFNLQRAILAKEGHQGRKDDQLRDVLFTMPFKGDHSNPEAWMPGKDGEPISRLDAVVERDKFDAMMTEYYQLRGWDPATGRQTEAKLRQVGLDDIIPDLRKIGALA